MVVLRTWTGERALAVADSGCDRRFIQVTEQVLSSGRKEVVAVVLIV
jgi:hypothetical protein